jgi:hypothetical protein
VTGPTGGAGGAPGAAGATGGSGTLIGPGAGGAAGDYIQGNSFITWINVGDVAGGVA